MRQHAPLFSHNDGDTYGSIHLAVLNSIVTRHIRSDEPKAPHYSFPHVQKLLSISGGELKLLTTLKTLKSVRFVSVKITQRVVEYLLSDCHLLEQVSISTSNSLKNLEVSDSLPKLRSMVLARLKNLAYKVAWAAWPEGEVDELHFEAA
ncbi:hypothetical protein RND71_014322 [Anisodus tanguticus]|uniref:FBD domain-containing protein n=1 Tax=Anisodus tanguticus TaxID=243964 RepID=A0AAE1VEY7_9SOLA|nr:hypothetical protein RND71_014322 [Anisodus tanguticus]